MKDLENRSGKSFTAFDSRDAERRRAEQAAGGDNGDDDDHGHPAEASRIAAASPSSSGSAQPPQHLRLLLLFSGVHRPRSSQPHRLIRVRVIKTRRRRRAPERARARVGRARARVGNARWKNVADQNNQWYRLLQTRLPAALSVAVCLDLAPKLEGAKDVFLTHRRGQHRIAHPHVSSTEEFLFRFEVRFRGSFGVSWNSKWPVNHLFTRGRVYDDWTLFYPALNPLRSQPESRWEGEDCGSRLHPNAGYSCLSSQSSP